MTTTAATWFYRTPERAPYLLGERVRTTFWDARLTDLWLETVSTDGPFIMDGTHAGASIKLEWEPAKWLRLSTVPASPSLAHGVTNILRRRASLSYEAQGGHTVWEWWVSPEEADGRWQEIQGKPGFRNPTRLSKAN